MPTRHHRPAWTGTLQKVPGRWSNDQLWGTARTCAFPKRAADDAGGTTSRRQLIAAAHSACYAMSLSNEVGQAAARPARSISRPTSALDPIRPVASG